MSQAKIWFLALLPIHADKSFKVFVLWLSHLRKEIFSLVHRGVEMLIIFMHTAMWTHWVKGDLEVLNILLAIMSAFLFALFMSSAILLTELQPIRTWQYRIYILCDDKCISFPSSKYIPIQHLSIKLISSVSCDYWVKTTAQAFCQN